MLTFAADPVGGTPLRKQTASTENNHAEGDGDDHGKPAVRAGDSPAAGAHAHSEAEGEEGHIKMTTDQIANQDIKLAPVEGGTLSRHILVPGTITPDTDRIARVPAKVVGTVAEMRKRLG
ncbi:efflux transporter periplasmic adaptor subunit, partial [Methylobacterium oxalidis]